MRMIVFEGLDGTGKSTLLYETARQLTEKGHFVATYAMPSKLRVFGREARNLFGVAGKVDENLRLNIRDMLNVYSQIQGNWNIDFVLIDRWIYSSIAYQCYLHGLSLNRFYEQCTLHKFSALPDKVVYCHCDRNASIERVIARDGNFSSDLALLTEDKWVALRQGYNYAFGTNLCLGKQAKLLTINTAGTTPKTEVESTILPFILT